METAQIFLETEIMLENMVKKSCFGGLLRYKLLYYASLYENLSVSMIIEKLKIKKSNFTLLAAELENDGLLEIKHTETDRRCRTLILTEKGRLELKNFMDCLNECFSEVDLATQEAIEKVYAYLNKRN